MDNGKKNEMSRSDQDDLRIDMYSKMVANLRDIPQDIEGSYMVGHALLHLKDSVISRLYYDRDNPPTAERVQEIKNTVDEAMDAGRKGIGDAAVNGEYAFAFNDISAQINKELAHAVHRLAAAQQSDKAQQSNFQSQQTYISGPSQG